MVALSRTYVGRVPSKNNSSMEWSRSTQKTYISGRERVGPNVSEKHLATFHKEMVSLSSSP